MEPYEYYNELKKSARQLRKKYDITGPKVLPRLLQSILKSEGVVHIQLFSRKDFKGIRGAYQFDTEVGPIVYLGRELLRDQKAFTLAHELKHHLHDRDQTVIYCGDSNVDAKIEIGAEIFAAEFICPADLFVKEILKLCGTRENFNSEHLVHFKQQTDTTLSYASLSKHAVFNNFARQGSLDKIKWRDLEDELYPNPFRKRKKGKDPSLTRYHGQ